MRQAARVETSPVTQPDIQGYTITDLKKICRNIPDYVLAKALTISSYILKEAGSHIVICGANNALMAYLLAVLNPRHRYTAIDSDTKAVDKAVDRYALPHLTYLKGDGIHIPASIGKVDAIVNIDFLHEVYSAAAYNGESVAQCLKAQYERLDIDGQIITYDYLLPSHAQRLVEMSFESTSPLIEVLLSFSTTARPMQPSRCQGFYLQEVTPKFSGTRLFVLPLKWAQEFALRKDYRNSFTAKLLKEFTFYDQSAFQRCFEGLGARIEYAGAHSREEWVKACCVKQYTLYERSGQRMDYPSAHYMAVIKKIDRQDSAKISELRPCSDQEYKALVEAAPMIMPVRDTQTDVVHEIVVMKHNVASVLPYKMTPSGKVQIFLNQSVERPLGNLIKDRDTQNEQPLRSGHVITSIEVDFDKMAVLEREGSIHEVTRFLKEQGFRPVIGKRFTKGVMSVPAPLRSTHQYQPYYIEVEASNNLDYKAFEAEDILRAIQSGVLNNRILETQIYDLFHRLDLKCTVVEEGAAYNIPVGRPHGELLLSLDAVQKAKKGQNGSYVVARGRPGQVKNCASWFVSETMRNGSYTGHSAKVHHYVTSLGDDAAVTIVPVMRDLSGELMVGFVLRNIALPLCGVSEFDDTILDLPSLSISSEQWPVGLLKKEISKRIQIDSKNISFFGEEYFEDDLVSSRKCRAVLVGGDQPTSFDEVLFYAPLSVLDQVQPSQMSFNLRWILNRLHGSYTNEGRSISLRSLLQEPKRKRKK